MEECSRQKVSRAAVVLAKTGKSPHTRQARIALWLFKQPINIHQKALRVTQISA